MKLYVWYTIMCKVLENYFPLDFLFLFLKRNPSIGNRWQMNAVEYK